MAKAVQETPTKFTVEYFTEDKKIDARWHYDYSKTKNGPVLVENFNIPQQEKVVKKKKKS